MQQWKEVNKVQVYLDSYLRAKTREYRILEEIERLQRDQMLPCVIRQYLPDGMEYSDLPECKVLAEAEIAKLDAERLDIVKIYTGIEQNINALEKGIEQVVLRLRYLEGLSWEEIGSKTEYSRAQLYRIYTTALKKLKKLKDEIECPIVPVI